MHYYLHYGSPGEGTYLYFMKRYHNQHHFVHHNHGTVLQCFIQVFIVIKINNEFLNFVVLTFQHVSIFRQVYFFANYNIGPRYVLSKAANIEITKQHYVLHTLL